MRFDFTTRASPEQVLRALTDFTESRLETWNRTLDPKTYELRESGQTWAVARESSPRSPRHTSCARAVRPGLLRGKAVLDHRDIRAARERSDLGCCAGKQSSITVLGRRSL
jgi:hypothetical protein